MKLACVRAGGFDTPQHDDDDDHHHHHHAVVIGGAGLVHGVILG